MLITERRPPTDEERSTAFPTSSLKRRADDVAWCVAPMFGFVGGGWAIQQIVREAGGDIAPWPVVVGAALGALLGGFFASLWIRRVREQRVRTLDAVEILRVTNARFAEMEEHNDEGPHYFVQVDSEQLLLLSGQWLFDPFIVAETADTSFPSSEFELVRDPMNGQVLSLHPSGEKKTPVQTFKTGELPFGPEFPFADSVVFRGRLDALATAIAAASEGVN